MVTGTDAKVESKRSSFPARQWEENELPAATVQLTGKNLGGSDLSKDFTITRTTARVRSNSGRIPRLFFKSVSSYRIDLTWSRMGFESTPDLIIREVPERRGRVKKVILVKLDCHNVTEKDLTRVVGRTWMNGSIPRSDRVLPGRGPQIRPVRPGNICRRRATRSSINWGSSWTAT